MEQLLEGALIKLSSAVSSLSQVKTARDILEAIAGGERDLRALTALASSQVKGGRAAIEQALEGMMPGGHHPRLIRIHLDHIPFLDRSAGAVDSLVSSRSPARQANPGVC